MKVAAAFLALISLVSAVPATSEAQISSLEKRALPAGWTDCGALSDPVQVHTFAISPYKPKWTDKITISNIKGQVRKQFTVTTVRAMVQITFKSFGGTTINTGWINTPSVCNTFNLFGCIPVTVGPGSDVSAPSASFTPSDMLANEPSLKSAFDTGATISIKIRIINDYDGQQIDCVENQAFVA
jgi:hypothetical protein